VLHLRPCCRINWTADGATEEWLADVLCAFTLPATRATTKLVDGVEVDLTPAELLASHTPNPFLFVQWHEIIIPTYPLPVVFSCLTELYSIVPVTDVVSRVFIRPQLMAIPSNLVAPLVVTAMSNDIESTFPRVICQSNKPVLRVG
jgi:hypothetical protein